MTDFYINASDETGPNGNRKLINVIDRVKENDEIIITLGTDDKAQLRAMTETLDNKGFEYLTKGAEDGRKYEIIAHLKK